MSAASSVFHFHGHIPCWGTTCASPDNEWTREDLEAEGLLRLATEASGVCPDSGEKFMDCMRGPCDCFLTIPGLNQYVDGCRSELIRQVRGKKRA